MEDRHSGRFEKVLPLKALEAPNAQVVSGWLDGW